MVCLRVEGGWCVLGWLTFACLTSWYDSSLIEQACVILAIKPTCSLSTAVGFLTSTPTLPELLNYKTSSGRTMNIFQQIGTHYSKLGPLLLNDDTGAVTDVIVSQHQCNAETINQEILTRWLMGQGKLPVTWSTLLDVFRVVGLLKLAKVIQEDLTSSVQPFGETVTR